MTNVGMWVALTVAVVALLILAQRCCAVERLNAQLLEEVAEHAERERMIATLASGVAARGEEQEREIRRLKRDLKRAENYISSPSIEPWPEIDRRTGNSAPSPLDAIFPE
jgi:arginine deiminase